MPVIDIIDELASLAYSPPNSNFSLHRLCMTEEYTVNIDIDFMNCIQNKSNELHADVYVHDGFLYLLLRNQHVVEVAHYEYRDIDDFWVSVDYPDYSIAQWQQIQVVRFSYASVLPCIDSAKLRLRIGTYCEDTSPSLFIK